MKYNNNKIYLPLREYIRYSNDNNKIFQLREWWQ